ncbi:flagellar motor switch protein FliN/FliY [Hydrogenivirga caldilitoris]|uniref:Flagellar motor switch protein FliN n=1 Tax=Hydrogenivirga caldilitoris TaxID=246264 RepID=A0A497XM30_9AQUI|nr:flagellar motor switch protein FliN [Hydrogenivirga caldilitoris]RLJ69848.1 flagellar motor switch protein FliN/FliY [Hydrogenivirga caldilitoris]
MADEEKKEEELSQEELAKQWEEALAKQEESPEAKEEAPASEEEKEAYTEPEAGKKVTEKDITKLLDRLMDIPLNVEVVVGSTVIQIRELINLGPGSVLELDRETTEPVDIKVNGKLIAKGELVVVGERFGVRITEIYSEERKSVFRDTLQESLRK